MAATKINFYLGLLMAVSLIGINLSIFGNSLYNNPNIILNNDSILYIGNFSNNLDSSGINNFNDGSTASELKKEGIITQGNETEGFGVTDNLATIYWGSVKLTKISSWLNIAYNIPSFLIYALGLPINPFRNVINIFGIILFISFVVLLVRLVRGS